MKYLSINLFVVSINQGSYEISINQPICGIYQSMQLWFIYQSTYLLYLSINAVVIYLSINLFVVSINQCSYDLSINQPICCIYQSMHLWFSYQSTYLLYLSINAFMIYLLINLFVVLYLSINASMIYILYLSIFQSINQMYLFILHEVFLVLTKERIVFEKKVENNVKCETNVIKLNSFWKNSVYNQNQNQRLQSSICWKKLFPGMYIIHRSELKVTRHLKSFWFITCTFKRPSLRLFWLKIYQFVPFFCIDNPLNLSKICKNGQIDQF